MNLRIPVLVIGAIAVTVATGCREVAVEDRGYEEFGGGVPDTSRVTPIPKIVEAPALHDGRQVTVKGIIASVCPSSGCFLYLGEGSSQIKVDLKKEGFTIPPGQNIGHVAYATGAIRAVREEATLSATGLRILEK